MRLPTFFSILFSLALISSFSSCEKEKDTMGTLQFECSVPVLKSSGSAITVNSAIVSINDTKGNSIYSNQKIEILNMNGYYISKPLSIKPGDYVLSSFLLCDKNNTIVYASPVKDSPKAYLVQTPLPIDFKISKDQVSKLVPEVISATDAVPSDFGYATFSFNVVETFDLFIAAFAYEESNKDFYLTDALLTISASGKPSMNFKLENKTNILEIPAGYGEYTLSIKKTGYRTQTRVEKEISLKSFNGQTDSAVMKVILEEGCTLPSGLIAYYPFNGNANDESGSGYHGSMQGSIFGKDRSGIDQSSAYFDGINKTYVKLGNSFDLKEKTICLWFMCSSFNSASAYNSIYSSDNPNLLYGDTYLHVEKKDNNFNLLFHNNVASWDLTNVYSCPINFSKWYFVSITVDNEYINYYLDGKLVKSNINNHLNLKSIEGFPYAVLGTSRLANAAYFTGSIDDVYIFNRALSETELLNLYDIGY